SDGHSSSTTSPTTSVLSGSGNWSKNDLPKVLSQPSMPVFSGVGRGMSAISFTQNLASVRWRLYSSTVGKNQGASEDGSQLRAWLTARIAVAMAATFPWPPSSATKRPRERSAIDAGDHKLGLAHPVQGGIGEHSVELGDEVQRMAVHFADGEPLHARNREQLVAQIDAKHIGAGRLDLFRQRAVAAAKIENSLASLRREHG